MKVNYNKEFLNKKIFIAGHKGMVGIATYNQALFLGFKKKNILIASKKKINLTNYNKVNYFIKKHKPDIVINCAGKVGGILANDNYPKEFLFENIKIQLNLIESCRENKIKYFVNLGSSCIYPKNISRPIKEDDLLSGKLESTNEAYALAKIVGLKSCQFYNKQFKTFYFTIMPCNLYGPNDNFNSESSHFLPALINKFYTADKKKYKTVELWGTGNPKRELLYVSDLADAIFFILNNVMCKNKKILIFLKKRSFINVGSNKDYTIKFYAKKISSFLNNNFNIKFNKKYPDGTKRKLLDSSILYNLGWKPKINLDKGIALTINWYKNLKN
jgi:GDP-L-fucose synthase